MKLSDVELNTSCEIVDVVADENYQHRLAELGMLVGCSICPLRKNHGTLVLDVQGCRYALGKQLSDCIIVRPCRSMDRT